MNTYADTLSHVLRRFSIPHDTPLTKVVIPDKGRGRQLLAELFRDLGFTYGAEIGIETGLYSQKLCEVIPGLKLVCIDPWKEWGYTWGKVEY